jgi:ATP-binding cassette, subfamily B, bacterial CvaB/MchF/RaxB
MSAVLPDAGSPASALFKGTSKLRFGWGKPVQSILQTEAAECGLACLAMIANYHGYQTDLATLRQRFALSLRGATLKQVMNMAHGMKLAARPLRLDLEELDQLQLPCILHWELNHFVVLKKVLGNNKGVVILDPARGERTIRTEELSKCFTGVALELAPMADFAPKKEQRTVKISQLLGKVVGLKRSLVQVFVLALALEAFAIVSPFFMQWVVDGAIVAADSNLLTLLCIGFGLLMVIQTAIGLARSWVVLYLSTHLNVQWISNVFAHLIRLPVTYFERRHLGDVVTRFESVHQIQQTLTTSFIEGVLDGLLGMVMLIIIFIYSPTLAWVVIAALLIQGLIAWLSYAPTRRLAAEQINLSAKNQSQLFESIRAVQSIKLFASENDRQARYVNGLVESTNRTIATQRLNLSVGAVSGITAGLENILVVWLGATAVMQNQLSVGMLFAFMSYKATFSGRIQSLIRKFIEFKMLKLQGDLLADIVLNSADPASSINAGAKQLPPNEDAAIPEIEVRNVSFRYSPGEPWILKNVNLKVAKGESLAIVGPSGGGKTTLMKLMLGLMPPTEGEILFRGQPIQHLGATYRQAIGAVMQDDQLLSGSIAENIAFFSQTPDQDRIRRCAEQAAIARDIENMPMQYQTLIGDMGSTLSGGQRQRIVLARALYREPTILFLDEATSHLDAQTEAMITEVTKQLTMTMVVIAHRTETIQHCKQIVVVQATKVALTHPGISPNPSSAGSTLAKVDPMGDTQ